MISPTTAVGLGGWAETNATLVGALVGAIVVAAALYLTRALWQRRK